MNHSGIVPRELLAGIIWDDESESMFQATLTRVTTERGWSLELAMREARYTVELHLHRVFYKKQISRFTQCHTDKDKWALYRSWVVDFGLERADRLTSTAKSSKLRATALDYA